MTPVPANGDHHFSVGGLVIRLARRQGAPSIVPSVSDSPFIIDPAPPDLDLEVAWGREHLKPNGDLLFESGGPWKLHREADRLVFSVYSSLLGPEPYKVARVAPDFRSGEILLRRDAFSGDGPVDPLQFPLDELLVIHLLGTGLGVEVHACGLIDADGRGILFCGQSGDGKTTTSRLWDGIPGTRILSDDRIILRRKEGRFWMYGTPWHGDAEYAENEGVPLTAIFILDRGDTNRAVALAPEEAVALLFARSFLSFYSREALEFTLRFFEELAGAIPVRRLPFVPDESAPEFVRGLL
jgi:hypothetical protein